MPPKAHVDPQSTEHDQKQDGDNASPTQQQVPPPPPPPQQQVQPAAPTAQQSTASSQQMQVQIKATTPPKSAATNPPPQPKPATLPPSHPLEVPPTSLRPCVALSKHIVPVFKLINSKYCAERRSNLPGPKYNEGYDDHEGHYRVIVGEEIMDRFTVQEVLGKGTFGTVVRCYDEKYEELVAVKITRRGTFFYNQAKQEIEIVLALNDVPELESLVVKIRKAFVWKDHIVLVFELLSFSLYHLIRCTNHNGVSLDLTRKFAYQLLRVLQSLETAPGGPIFHSDLKPENILLRDKDRSGIRVIDFGSACYARTVSKPKYIQSRYYRCPEVILHLPYDAGIDRWSLGCVLVELHTGRPLFPGRTEKEQLARFTAVLGPLPESMIQRSKRKSTFFNEVDKRFALIDPPTPEMHKSLTEILGVTTGGPRGSRAGQPGHEVERYREFCDLVAGLLTYDPQKRISCTDALNHPFVQALLPKPTSS